MWVLTVRPGEELPGIQAIAFNGEVNPQHTPARKAPVLVDDTGALVSLQELPPGREEERTGRVRLRVERGVRLGPSGELPGYGTHFNPLPARFGYTVTLYGEDERRAATLLRDRAPDNESPAVREFVAWLARGCLPPHPEGAQEIGRLVLWYCSEWEVAELWIRIQQEARRALFLATARGKPEDMVRTSWWLSRVAHKDEDLYLAAAGLESGGSSDSESMLRAMLEEPPKAPTLNKRLHHAFERLKRCAAVVAISESSHSRLING